MELCSTVGNPSQNVHYFYYSQRSELMLSDVDTCVESPLGGLPSELSTYACHSQGGNQHWEYDKDTGAMRHGANGCLTDIGSDQVQVAQCTTPLTANQQWDFVQP